MTKKGVLLIHGFSGTPESMEYVDQYLANKGFITHSLSLPGHITTEEDFAKVTYQDWSDAVHHDYLELSAKVDDCFVVGLSMGAVLAADLAASHHGIKGVAYLAPAFFIAPWIEYVVDPILQVWPLTKLFKWKKREFDLSLADPEAKQIYSKLGYKRFPLHALHQLILLQQKVRSKIDVISTPALIIHGEHDLVTPVQNSIFLYNGLTNVKRKELLYLSRSKHVLTMDYEKEIVAGVISGFFD